MTSEPGADQSDTHSELRQALEARAEVLEAYVFGSVARGDATAHSDLDVAVFVEPAKLDGFPYGYEADLGAALQQALGRVDIDITVLNRAGPVLYHNVLRDGIRVLSRNLPLTTTREGQALSRYCDYVPTLERIEAVHRARITSGGFGR